MVFVVDDDCAVREGLERLLRSVGYEARCFACAADFLALPAYDRASCLLLDVRMPGRNGLDLQDELRRRNVGIPIIFLTGHGDVPMSVRAIKGGALEFLLKPFREQDLLDAVNAALAQDRGRRAVQAEASELRECFEALSDRERHILIQAATGLSSKEIAAQLGLQEITIKVHRARAMRKINARSIVDLVAKIDRMRDVFGQRAS